MFREGTSGHPFDFRSTAILKVECRTLAREPMAMQGRDGDMHFGRSDPERMTFPVLFA